MIEWYFELIFFNSRRMHIDTADGIITTIINVKSYTLKHAEQNAETIVSRDPLTDEGWYAKITVCDASHALKILKIQNGEAD